MLEGRSDNEVPSPRREPGRAHGLAGPVQIGQYRVKGVEFVNVTMAADGRTGLGQTQGEPKGFVQSCHLAG